MKDNNKRVFLGIIMISTLVIAIIGATFAFFSASGGSANNAITANATTLANLGFTSSHSKIATNLVPVASENPYFYRYPGIAASGNHSCLDDVGNEICSIYEFTITNTASVAQTIYVSFVPSENTFDNMYFAAFNTTIASADYTVATGSSGSGSNFVLTPQTTASNSTLGHTATKLTKNSTTPINMPGLSTSLGAGESVSYTILVWLQETGDTQNTEQGGVFKAGVNVTTGGNATGVTGLLDGSSDNYVYTLSIESGAGIGDPIPNNMDTYQTAASAMASWLNVIPIELPYYLKFKMTNDIISETHIEFMITPAMASANSGMVTGTYSLRGGDGGTSYNTNVSKLTTAFGIDKCTEDTSYAISIYTCTVPGLKVYVHSDGYVQVYAGGGKVYNNGADYWYCGIDSNNGWSFCGDASS